MKKIFKPKYYESKLTKKEKKRLLRDIKITKIVIIVSFLIMIPSIIFTIYTFHYFFQNDSIGDWKSDYHLVFVFISFWSTLAFICSLIVLNIAKKTYKNNKHADVVVGVVEQIRFIGRGRTAKLCIDNGKYRVTWADAGKLEPGMCVIYRHLKDRLNFYFSVERYDNKMYDPELHRKESEKRYKNMLR